VEGGSLEEKNAITIVVDTVKFKKLKITDFDRKFIDFYRGLQKLFKKVVVV